MASDRWPEIEALFFTVQDLPPAQRAEVLAAADPFVCREVESLLAQGVRTGALDAAVHRAIGAAAEAALEPAVRFEPGTSIGPYNVISSLGRGGMGEVYRARDRKLGRDVAIKVLPAAVAADVNRGARLEREARTLAALNHPNIAAIYGLEEHDGTTALVLELVEGQTLAVRITHGRIETREALSIAEQIADALEAAHELGIVHRDLKPANIIVRDDGTVKVLDFGLAKAFQRWTSSDADTATSAVVPARATEAGIVLGTAPYMAPEQARGRPVDHRADIWAFGCVLFEMLAGRRAFDGADVADILAAIVSGEPDWERLPANATQVRPLLSRCLRKDLKQRLQAIGDARIQIEELIAGGSDAPTLPARVSASRRIRPLAIAAVAGAVVAGGAAVWMPRTGGVTAVPARLEIVPRPSEALAALTADRNLVVSPDGRHVVYRSGNPARLVLRPIDRREGKVLEGTAGARSPFFSPDSRSIGFFDGVALKRVSVAGGPVLTICQSPIPRGASWGDDGYIVFATQDETRGLLRVPEEGGEPIELSKPDRAAGDRGHRNPWVLPGGRGVLFTIVPVNRADPTHVAILDPKTGRSRKLVAGAVDPEYLDTGHLVYAATGRLWAVGFDLSRLEVVGEPTPVVDDVLVNDDTATAHYSVSRQGTLVYIPRRPVATGSLLRIDRSGKETPVAGPTRDYLAARLSPDARRAAVTVSDQGQHIQIMEMDTGSMVSFATVGDNMRPVWSADGSRIIYASTRDGGATNLYSQAADGTGPVERLSVSPYPQGPAWASPDGSGVVGTEVSPGTAGDIVWFPVKKISDVRPASGARPTPATASPLERLIHTAGIDFNPEVSSDRRFLAYQSNESGRDEVLVRPLTGSFSRVDDGQWRASDDGGTHPAWARDGTKLFYIDLSNVLTAVEVQTGGARPTFGRRTKLFSISAGTQDARPYDPAPDGGFLVVKRAQSGAEPDVIVVAINWREELKERLSVR